MSLVPLSRLSSPNRHRTGREGIDREEKGTVRDGEGI